MNDDTIFRTKVEPTEVKQPVDKINNSVATPISDDIEVPYLDYRSRHAKSYLADYFKLGDRWDDPEGGFPDEIAHMEEYIKDQIDMGEIANSVPAVKNMLAKMEKFNNLKGEERTVVKIEMLSNYIEFLQKNNKVKQNLRRYATNN